MSGKIIFLSVGMNKWNFMQRTATSHVHFETSFEYLWESKRTVASRMIRKDVSLKLYTLLEKDVTRSLLMNYYCVILIF